MDKRFCESINCQAADCDNCLARQYAQFFDKMVLQEIATAMTRLAKENREAD